MDLNGEGAIVATELSDEGSQLLNHAEGLAVHFELHGRVVGRWWEKLLEQGQAQGEFQG